MSKLYNILSSLITRVKEVQSDLSQTDETKIDRSEIEEIDAIEIVVDAGLVSPATADDGAIYTDENGAMYSL